MKYIVVVISMLIFSNSAFSVSFEEFKMHVSNGDLANVLESIRRSPGLVRETDRLGQSAFHFVQNMYMVPILLRSGADINSTDYAKQTVLQYAVHAGKICLVRSILRAEADANLADIRGRTPLHLAAQAGNTRIVSLLLESGADINLTDNRSKTALDYAIDYEHSEAVVLLTKAFIAKRAKRFQQPISQEVQQISKSRPIEEYSSGVQYLMNRHLLQEALWLARSEEASEEIQRRIKSELVRTFEGRPVSTKNMMEAGGITSKLEFKFDHEIKAIFKHDGGSAMVSEVRPSKMSEKEFAVFAANPRSEVAAYEFDELIGANLVPYTTLKDFGTSSGSLMYFIRNAIPGTAVVSKDFERLTDLAVEDFIIGNVDRHFNNFLYFSAQDRYVAIDHGLSFREFEGGCLYDHVLYATFGSKEKCLGEGRTPREYLDFYRNKRFFNEIYLYNMSKPVKEKILNLSYREIRSKLSSNVQPKYLDKVIERFLDIQAELNSKK